MNNIEFSDVKTKKKKRKRGHNHQHKVVEEFKEKIVSLIINKQLNNMLDNLSMQSNSSY